MMNEKNDFCVLNFCKSFKIKTTRVSRQCRKDHMLDKWLANSDKPISKIISPNDI